MLVWKMKKCELRFGQNRFQLLSSKAIFWEDESLIIVSDLHLEKGSSFQRAGIFLPPYDSLETISRLNETLIETKASRVLFLGDTFHDKNAFRRMHVETRSELNKLSTRYEFIWISGNHELSFQDDTIELLPEIKIRGLTFRHKIATKDEGFEVTGHFHPVVKARVNGVSITGTCFFVTQTKIILPAFGAFTGGLNIKDQGFPLGFSHESKIFLAAHGNIIEIKASTLD